MITVTYDGSFEGWLTAVFDVYEYKFQEVHICSKDKLQPNVFNSHHETQFDKQKASRVAKGLAAKLSTAAVSQLYKAFLSEEKGIENLLLKYVQYVFGAKKNIERDYSHPAVLAVAQMAKKVHWKSTGWKLLFVFN